MSNKTAATWHPYASAEEARAAREAKEERKEQARRVALIVKRAALA